MSREAFDWVMTCLLGGSTRKSVTLLVALDAVPEVVPGFAVCHTSCVDLAVAAEVEAATVDRIIRTMDRAGVIQRARRFVIADQWSRPEPLRINYARPPVDVRAQLARVNRSPIPASVRQIVYSRDGWRCRECLTPEDLTLDHVLPWSRGGSDHHSNLRTLCRRCNSRKGAGA